MVEDNAFTADQGNSFSHVGTWGIPYCTVKPDTAEWLRITERNNFNINYWAFKMNRGRYYNLRPVAVRLDLTTESKVSKSEQHKYTASVHLLQFCN